MPHTQEAFPVVRSTHAVAWAGGLVALLLGCVLFFFLYRDARVRLAAAERQSQALAEGTARLVRLELRNLERAMGGVAGDAQQLFASVPEAAPKLLSESMAGVVRRHAELQSLVLVDRQGVAITDGVGVQIPPDARVVTARGGRHPLSFARLQRADGEWVLPLLMPMDDGRWIVLRLRVAELQRLIGNLDTGRTGVVTVLDGHGTVVARSRDAGRFIGRDYPELIPRTPRGMERRASAVDGVERVTAHTTLPEYRLYMSAGLGTNEVMRDWYLLLIGAVLLYALYCGGFLYLLRHLCGSTAAQKHLVARVERIAEGLRLAQRVGKTGTWRIRATDGRVEWSEQVSAIFGQPEERHSATPEEFYALVHPDDREDLRARFADAWRQREAFVTEYRIVRPDGEVRWIASRGGAVARQDGALTMTGIVVDVTAERDAQERLLQAERQYRLLFDRNPLPFWVFDAATLAFLEVNEAAVRNYGYSRAEFLSMSILDIRPPEDSGAVKESLLSSPDPDGEIWRHLKKDGSIIDVRVYTADITYGDRPAKLVLAEDISRTLAYERDLNHHATHDSTTGLYNLPGLRAWARDHLSAGGHLVYVQLRGIEPVIDSLGQAVATRLLQTLANRIEGLALQWGGRTAFVPSEAFVLALPESVDMDEAAPEVHGAATTPVEQGGSLRTLEAWLGSRYTGIGEQFDTGVSQAALAAHVARAEGATCRAFHTDMATAAGNRLRMIGRIQQALDRREFELHFQPITRIDESRPASVEALLRWPQPGGGFVPPSQFIALSEDAGLILALGDWVLEEAVQCHQRLTQAGWGDLPIAINVSPLQLARLDFAERMVRLQQEAGLRRGALHIEVTESVLLDHPEATMHVLRLLQRHGVCTSLDDFGTGFSSMAYLHKLPLDALKIDQTFVRGVDHDERSAAICRALISLGHNLGLTLVAEGVETPEQLAWLRKHRCDQVQGYLIAKPMGMEALLEYLAGVTARAEG